jgi:hypothetical protein
MAVKLFFFSPGCGRTFSLVCSRFWSDCERGVLHRAHSSGTGDSREYHLHHQHSCFRYLRAPSPGPGAPSSFYVPGKESSARTIFPSSAPGPGTLYSPKSWPGLQKVHYCTTGTLGLGVTECIVLQALPLLQNQIQSAVQPTFSKTWWQFSQRGGSPANVVAVQPTWWQSSQHFRKRGVKFSAVFITVRFRIVLSVFGEKAESNFAFSAKPRSSTIRCRRKCGVKLCAFGSIQRIQRRSEIMRFWRIHGVKRSVFANNAE